MMNLRCLRVPFGACGARILRLLSIRPRETAHPKRLRAAGAPTRYVPRTFWPARPCEFHAPMRSGSVARFSADCAPQLAETDPPTLPKRPAPGRNAPAESPPINTKPGDGSRHARIGPRSCPWAPPATASPSGTTAPGCRPRRARGVVAVSLSCGTPPAYGGT